MSLNASEFEQKIDTLIRLQYGPGKDTAPGLAVMVSRDGNVLLKKGYGMSNLETSTLVSASTNFRMASVSKQFTAMAIYLLIEQGALSFDTPLGEIFKGLAAAPARTTVGQLLNHTSGLFDYEGLIPGDRREQVSDADVLELIRPVDSTYFPPGTQFRYSNTGFCLLSLVVEKVSGMEYRSYMHRYIFSSLAMQNAYMYHAGTDMPGRAFGYRPLRPVEGGLPQFRFADQSITSATKGDGCVYVSADSYLTWANALLRSGFPAAHYLQQLESHKTVVKDGIYYSMGWFVAPATASRGLRIFHSGETTGFRNMVYHDLGSGLSVSIFANRDDTLISGVFEGILELLGESHPAAELETPQELFFWMSAVY